MKSGQFMKRTVAVLSVGLALSLLLVVPVAITGAEQAPEFPKLAPQFVLKDLSGKEVKLSDFNGKALLVLFWTTWDKPSQQQLATLAELHQQYADKGFSALGVSLDDKGTNVVKAFADDHKISFPIVMADYKVIQDFGGLNAIPTTFVIEKNHHIIQKHVGVTDKTKLENDLKSLLER